MYKYYKITARQSFPGFSHVTPRVPGNISNRKIGQRPKYPATSEALNDTPTIAAYPLLVRYLAAGVFLAILPAKEIWSVDTESPRYRRTRESTISQIGGTVSVCQASEKHQWHYTIFKTTQNTPSRRKTLHKNAATACFSNRLLVEIWHHSFVTEKLHCAFKNYHLVKLQKLKQYTFGIQ